MARWAGVSEIWCPYGEMIKLYHCRFRSSSCLQMSNHQDYLFFFLTSCLCNENSGFGLGLNSQWLENHRLSSQPFCFVPSVVLTCTLALVALACECLMPDLQGDLKDIEVQEMQRWFS